MHLQTTSSNKKVVTLIIALHSTQFENQLVTNRPCLWTDKLGELLVTLKAPESRAVYEEQGQDATR